MKIRFLMLIVLALVTTLGYGQLGTKVKTHKARVASPFTAGSHYVDLSWTQSVSGSGYTITGNNVYRANGACPQGSYAQIFSSPTIPIIAYSDTAVAGLATYCYVVTAVYDCPTCSPAMQESGYSNTAQAIIPPDVITVPPPTGLIVGTIAMNQVPLFWNEQTPGTGYTLASYRMYRGTKPTMPKPSLIATISPVLLTYTDSKCRGTCYYYVKAYDKLTSGGYQLSAPSNIVKAVN